MSDPNYERPQAEPRWLVEWQCRTPGGWMQMQRETDNEVDAITMARDLAICASAVPDFIATIEVTVAWIFPSGVPRRRVEWKS